MRIASKLRRAVTVSTAARKLRQAALTNYEKKFRSMVQKCKTIAALLEKVRLTSTQHMQVYAALTESIVVWKEHPQDVKKSKKKKPATPKKAKPPKKPKKNTKKGKGSQEPEEETPAPAPPVAVSETEYEQVSTLITDTVASYNADFKEQVKTPLTEWQKQVTTVLRTMVSKTHQARDHLDHYEMKLVSVQNQHTKLTASSSATPAALEQSAGKVERNEAKLAGAQKAYDDCLAGMEQCSQALDQAANDIWPLIQKVLSLEQSYTSSQLLTVQGRLTTLVSDLQAVASDQEPTPSLQAILTTTMSKVEQPIASGAASVRNAAPKPVVKTRQSKKSPTKSKTPAAIDSSDSTPKTGHRSAATVVLANKENKQQQTDADSVDASDIYVEKSGPSPLGATGDVVVKKEKSAIGSGVEDASFLQMGTSGVEDASFLEVSTPSAGAVDEPSKQETIAPLTVAAIQEKIVDAQVSTKSILSEDSSMHVFADDDETTPAAAEVRKLSEETIPTSNMNEEKEGSTSAANVYAPADEVKADNTSNMPSATKLSSPDDVSETEIMDDEEDDIYRCEI